MLNFRGNNTKVVITILGGAYLENTNYGLLMSETRKHCDAKRKQASF